MIFNIDNTINFTLGSTLLFFNIGLNKSLLNSNNNKIDKCSQMNLFIIWVIPSRPILTNLNGSKEEDVPQIKNLKIVFLKLIIPRYFFNADLSIDSSNFQ